MGLQQPSFQEGSGNSLTPGITTRVSLILEKARLIEGVMKNWARHTPDTGGEAAPSRIKMRSHRSGADGVVGIAEMFRNALFEKGSIPDHPVRSVKGGFATSS